MEYTDYAISDIRFNSITSLPAGLLENHLQLEILYVLLDITIIVFTSFRNIDGNPIPELPSDLLKSKHNLQQLYDFTLSNVMFYLIISARYIPASLLLTFQTTFSTIASNCTKCSYQRDVLVAYVYACRFIVQTSITRLPPNSFDALQNLTFLYPFHVWCDYLGQYVIQANVLQSNNILGPKHVQAHNFSSAIVRIF